MRIVGGENRGLRLAEVGDAAGLRPTADRTREALLNLLARGRQGDAVTGARVLDLFAGTGALALEALSRGAAHATLVDDAPASARLIRDNVARAGRGAQARHLALDATRLPPNPDAPFSLAFLDPPYARALGDSALRAALAGAWLAPGATVAWEEAQPMMPPPGTTLLDRRRYGAAHVTVLKVEG